MRSSLRHTDRTRPGKYRLLSATCAAALLLLCTPGASKAQEYGIPPNVLRKQDLPERALLLLQQLHKPAVVTLKDGSDIRGELIDVTASDLTLLLEGTTLMEARVGVGWERIREVRIKNRSWIAEGIVLGGLGGALVGSLLPDDSDATKQYLGIEASQQVWDSALQGMVAGALIGAVRGLDARLPFPSNSPVTSDPFPGPEIRRRPTMRIVNTAPVHSITYRDIEDSIKPPLSQLQPRKLWNGQRASSVAIETSLPGQGGWWLRNRVEWTNIPGVGAREPIYGVGGGGGEIEIWREYRAIRAMVGLALPIGPVGRLPSAEVAIMGGLARTTLKSDYQYEWVDTFYPPSSITVSADSKQKVYRPLLLATGSLSLVRRPNLAVAIRAEGVFGPGFNANALTTDDGLILIPRHRITPTGFSIGLEVLIPNF